MSRLLWKDHALIRPCLIQTAMTLTPASFGMVHAPKCQYKSWLFGLKGVAFKHLLGDINLSIYWGPTQFPPLYRLSHHSQGSLDLLFRIPGFLLSSLFWPQPFCVALRSIFWANCTLNIHLVNSSSIFLGNIWVKKVNLSFQPKL